MNRFTELLADQNLSNLTYIYGEYDEEVGGLSNTEVEFLENKNASLFSIEKGDHSAMFQPEVLDQIVNRLIRN